MIGESVGAGGPFFREALKGWGRKAAGELMCPLFLHNCACRPFTTAEVVGALTVQVWGRTSMEDVH